MIWIGLVILAGFAGLAIHASLPSLYARRNAPAPLPGMDTADTDTVTDTDTSTDASPATLPLAHSAFRHIALIALPLVVAGGIYAMIGMPQTPSLPFAERAGERDLAAASATARNSRDPAYQDDQQIRRLLSQIVLSLEANPRNLQGWILLARGSLRLGDIDRAVAAFARAYALSGQNPQLAIEYADTRITAQQGTIDTVSRELILHAMGQMPNHYLSRYYYGMMLKQQQQFHHALTVLRDLYRDIPKDDPLGAATQAEIDALQTRLAADDTTQDSDTGDDGDSTGNAAQTGERQDDADANAASTPRSRPAN